MINDLVFNAIQSTFRNARNAKKGFRFINLYMDGQIKGNKRTYERPRGPGCVFKKIKMHQVQHIPERDTGQIFPVKLL